MDRFALPPNCDSPVLVSWRRTCWTASGPGSSTLGPARHALEIQDILDEPWRSAIVPATWLHDIGYRPGVGESGFHPLDGARFLEAGGWSSEICRLVAWHTAAGTEAQMRGLLPQMQAHPRPPQRAVDAITWADITSSPTGESVGPEERLAEILIRYPAGSLVHRSITACRSELLAAAARVELHLGVSRCRE